MGGAVNVTHKTDVTEKFSELSDHARAAQMHIEAARDKTKEDVEQAAGHARESSSAKAEKLREEVQSTDASVSADWKSQQESWSRHIQTMRERHHHRMAALDVEQAARQANEAADDAMVAIDYASSAIAEAESAVLDALAAAKNAEVLAASADITV
jgi:hypothetical protein